MAQFNRKMGKGRSNGGSRFDRGPAKFGRSNSSGNFRGRDRDDDFRGRTGKSRADYQMHKAICSRCGDECEVPFAPSGNKPVFCSACFKLIDNPRGRESRESSDNSSKTPMDEINRKLDKIMKALKIE